MREITTTTARKIAVVAWIGCIMLLGHAAYDHQTYGAADSFARWAHCVESATGTDASLFACDQAHGAHDMRTGR